MQCCHDGYVQCHYLTDHVSPFLLSKRVKGKNIPTTHYHNILILRITFCVGGSKPSAQIWYISITGLCYTLGMCLYHILSYDIVNSAGVKNMANTPGRSFKWCNHITYIHMQCKLLTPETITSSIVGQACFFSVHLQSIMI